MDSFLYRTRRLALETWAGFNRSALSIKEMKMTESMWSFLKRHAWLIICLLLVPSALSYFWPAAPAALTVMWSSVVPGAVITLIAHRESNRAKADQDVVMDAVSERLREGRLTEADRKLALRFYDQLRRRLHDAAVRGGPFKAGDSLHLVLLKAKPGGEMEFENILSKLHTAPYDVPPLDADEETFLTRIAVQNPLCAKIIVQWLFLSGGESAIQRIQEDGILVSDDAKISEFILDLLPKLPAEKYSLAVDYLKWRKHHLKGRTAVLRDLQDRLLDCEGQAFEDTVAVIGGINGEPGKAALDACWRELPRREKRRRECVDHEIAALKERIMLNTQPNPV